MSRIPPMMEQVINGQLTPGFQVLPLTEGGITYSVSSTHRLDANDSPIGQESFVTAVNEAGVEQWRTKYFSTEFEPGLETDVQEAYPVDFLLDGDTLVIKHEYHTDTERVYKIAKDTGALLA